jgi:hypothetical protein
VQRWGFEQSMPQRTEGERRDEEKTNGFIAGHAAL